MANNRVKRGFIESSLMSFPALDFYRFLLVYESAAGMIAGGLRTHNHRYVNNSWVSGPHKSYGVHT
jgi:hypothetical protein